jgi:HEAT repeat protein
MKSVFAALLLAAALVNAGAYTRTADASDDVSRLILQLHDPDVQHRRDAARELSKISPLPPQGIEVMAGLVEQPDQDALIASVAEIALCNAGASATPIATRFAHSRDNFISQKGIGLLGCLAPRDKNAWPVLIAIYKENPASNAIWYLATVRPPVLPVLIDALKSADPTMRAGAFLTIGRMVDNAIAFSADDAARNHIGIIAPKDRVPAEPELVAALQDTDPKIRNRAAIALNYADPTDKRALPIFINVLTERDVQSIGLAISGLKAMGDAAKPAVPALEHALATDEDVLIRSDAAKALVQIEGQAACAPLEQAIKKDRDWRTPQIRTMLGINPPCPRIIPALIATFADEYPGDSDALTALSKMGVAAVPALAAALKSSNLYVRQNSAEALAGMKPLPPDAARALVTSLNDKNSDVRDTAIAALRTVGGDAQQAAEAADKRDQQTKAEKPKPDTHLYSRKQIIAPIPADAEYMYPLTPVYIVPITKGAAAEATLYVTVHAGKDRADGHLEKSRRGPVSTGESHVLGGGLRRIRQSLQASIHLRREVPVHQ